MLNIRRPQFWSAALASHFLAIAAVSACDIAKWS
jgi:hypothetical protein